MLVRRAAGRSAFLNLRIFILRLVYQLLLGRVLAVTDDDHALVLESIEPVMVRLVVLAFARGHFPVFGRATSPLRYRQVVIVL